MKWVTAFILTVSLAGCHAPKPSFNLLAPYGSPRVPPPQTSSLGTRPPATATATPAAAGLTAPRSSAAPAGEQRSAATTAQPYLAANQNWTSVQDRAAALRGGSSSAVTQVEGDVRLAGFAAPAPSPAAESASPRPANNSALRLEAMPVNDATPSPMAIAQPTAAAAPAMLAPVANATPISHLPPPPPAAMTTNTVVATSQSSDAAQPATAGKSTLQWK